jgi:glycosyltransferase involved in cell wall biosynthesis
MRILFLSSTWPLPLNNGARMRTWALLRALAANGHGIVFLGIDSPLEIQAYDSSVHRLCEQAFAMPRNIETPPGPRMHLSRARNLFSRKPHSVEATRSKSAAQRIRELLDSGGIDAVFCEQTQPLINVPDPLPVPLFLDNHNAEHVIWQRFLRHARNPLARLYAWLESEKLREWERGSCERAKLAITCSEQDRRILQSLCPRTSFFVVPNALDTDRYFPASQEEPFKVLFQGGMDWYPNRDAVQHFVRSILPEIRGSIPGIEFVVAGRNPSRGFRRRLARDPHVRFTGTLEDIRPEVAGAAVCVVPLRIGSGTRLKILEAAAMEKAIVSTRLGAEGLEFRHNEEIVLADDPSDFAQAVVGLMRDARRRNWLGLNARKRVEEQYSFPVLCKTLEDAMAIIPEAQLPDPRELCPAGASLS